jgi:hypothetical protein
LPQFRPKIESKSLKIYTASIKLVDRLSNYL